MNSNSVTDDVLFESAFHFAAIGMAIVSLEGKWLKVNSSLCRMLGYTNDEFLALDFQRLTHPGDLEADLKQVKALLEREIDTYQLEKRYFHKSGSVVWGLLSVSLIRDDEGAPKFFISQIQDITSLKDGERLKALLRFSIQVAHEINNPLTIISLNAQTIHHWLTLPAPDLEKIGQSLSVLQHATERISAITKTMSGLTLEKTNIEFDPERVLPLLHKSFHES